MDYDLYLKNIDNLASQQKNTRYHILPSWIRLFEYFFPNSLFVEFKERLEKNSQDPFYYGTAITIFYFAEETTDRKSYYPLQR